MQTSCQGGRGSNRRRFGTSLFWAAVLASALVAPALMNSASASVTVLVGEPFDRLGRVIPVGHVSLYLDRVCADGPLRLRMCHPGEQAGVAIARYNRIGSHDWMATPILDFLYATNRAEDVLSYATPDLVNGLRQRYRHRFLADLFPEGGQETKVDDWWQTAGMAYSQRIWGYQIATSREQDERLVAVLNAGANRRSYAPLSANCANFAAELLDLYYPGIVRRDRLADLGVMLPKQVARAVQNYGESHPEAHLKVIEIPQVPGSIQRSWRVRGGAETFIKSKRYILPLLVLQPELAAGFAILYLDHGRWQIGRGAAVESPEAFLHTEAGAGNLVAAN